MNQKRLTYQLILSWILVAACLTGVYAAENKSAPAQYDHEVYELAYSVFLANKNLADAFTLADSAVRLRPVDLAWRKRLAQIATWTERPGQALEQLLAIHELENNSESLENVLRLARALNRDETLLTFLPQQLRQNGPESLWREYMDLCERYGRTEELMAVLSAAAQTNPRLFMLEQLAILAEHKGRPQESLNYLNRIVTIFGATPARALAQARINFVQGDLTAALGNLRGARATAVPADSAYWQTLGDIAWMLQEVEESFAAAETLYRHGAARMADLERMIIIRKETAPDTAFTLALDGWKKYEAPFFYLNMLDTGLVLKKWTALDEIYRSLSDVQRRKLEEAPYVWFSRIQVLDNLGKKPESLTVYRQAISRFPGNTDLVAGLVWLLIELRDRPALQRTLEEHQHLSATTSTIRNAYGSAFAFLNMNDAALPYFEAEEPNRTGDLLWLVSYADLLERTGRVRRAREVHLHAWRLVQQDRAALANIITNREKLLAVARLALTIAPGDTADAVMSLVVNGPRSETDREMILLWALVSERLDVARTWLRARIGQSQPSPPPWVELSMALHDNDREKMAGLLDMEPEELPIRDRVEAARRLGRYGEARDLAYRGLQREPDDYQLRRQYADLVVITANRFDIRSTFDSRGSLDQARTAIAGLYSVTPGLRLKPSIEVAGQRSTDPAALGPVPGADIAAELALSLLTRNGEVELGAGIRQGTGSTGTLRFKADRKLAADLNLTVTAGYHQPAPESVPLQISGLKNEIMGQIYWQATPRDTLSLTLASQFFSDQEGNSLGTGQKVAVTFTEKFEVPTPGLEFVSTVSANRFSPSGTPGATSSGLIPTPFPKDAGFFLPRGSLQFDAGLYSDRSFLYSYNRRWKMFGGMSILLNSISGLGYTGELGAAGPVFGHDRLNLTLRQGNDRLGSSSSVLSGEVSYTHYLAH